MSNFAKKVEIKQFISKDFLTTEAIKTLRTNLVLSGESVQMVALTSFSESEGKSTISFQLAASLAQVGKRVLLLDVDMRKSVLARRLQQGDDTEGLSHYLSGMANVNDLIHETDLPGMYVMFAGACVPNPVEMLSADSFQRLTTALREVFDYVVLDVAPLGQVIDCAVIGQSVDGILMVVDTTRNSYKMELRLKNQLERLGIKILGVVLNKVDFTDKHGYYGKIYGYGGYSYSK